MKSERNIQIRELDNSYNQLILEIIRRSPIETNSLEMFFDRSPDVFLSNKLWSDRFQYYGIFLDNELAGFGMHLKYRGYIRGKICDISYGGNYCIDKKFRKLGLFRELTEHMLKELYRDTSYAFCLILKDNLPAQKYFRKHKYHLKSMPAYKLAGSYETRNILIAGKRKQTLKSQVRKAEAGDYKLISRLLEQEYSTRLLAPETNEELFCMKLKERPGLDIHNYYMAFRDGHLVGISAAWDTGSFKRTRITRYKKIFFWIRLFYNLFSRLFGYPVLPESGEALREVYLTDTVIVDRDPEVMKDLIDTIYDEYRKRNYNLIYFGSFQGDPLLKAVRSFISIPLYGNIYFSARDEMFLKNESEKFHMPLIDISLIG